MLWEVADFKGRPGNASMAVEVINEVLLVSWAMRHFHTMKQRPFAKNH
jgi:hypothetical protein